VTNALIEQAVLEASGAYAPDAEILQALAEVSGSGTPNALIEQALAEVSITGLPNGQIAQALLEASVILVSYPMIPTVAFPTASLLAGQGWSVHRRPTFSTRIPVAVSGREVRTPFYATPLYEFELTYDGLLSGAAMGAIPAQSLQALQGFFLQLQGQYGSFLFTDPDFCQITGGQIGTGDGSTTTFVLQRSVGAYTEAVQAANNVAAVYINGVAQSSTTWSVANGNQIVFTTAPATSAVVTADFSYYFVCRFLDDVQDYEEMMYQIHTLKSCKFRTVRTS
jgi:uncharacterized protein (TIGR02217 family)